MNIFSYIKENQKWTLGLISSVLTLCLVLIFAQDIATFVVWALGLVIDGAKIIFT